jgi:phage virion morphogenesis protein
MNDNLEALEEWAGGLLSQLEPAARSKLARELGQALRRSQQQRIAAQRNPDGSKYVPRKQRDLRGKQGRVKRTAQMFKKLRTASHMKTRGDSNAVTVGFTGRVARIARVHQYGLIDQIEPQDCNVRYKQRKVLGFTAAEIDLIRDRLISHLKQYS